MQEKKIKLYSLTTCSYCAAIKKMLESLEVAHEFVDADLLDGEAQQNLLDELRSINPQCSFPTILIGETVITGYKIQEIKETIGIRTEVDLLYEQLQKINEPKGYYFNQDKERTFDLLRGLLTNKDRYGYMSCPCRLASGNRETDRDIICPCAYRKPDVKEFGACYCALYVSEEWNSKKIPQQPVPERRSTGN
ncbi:ferredoxin-thioredoxin reductase catalytic domain-containing protein [Desulfogranum marinum]|jgi:ferredoxin-thioredoxin reductase catalytic subunit/glutaredoxin|uniref:ferredoxin-thioredoxin reductase catalytic domain-containing protein n=1 Tax=Desulfogranum marinum TaxID=453220 RepID=UPI0029C73FB1|nr:ferredoxin-thioredoxin reductase catalytic domain-containing protein [Desulfogranum marinum]